MYLHVSTILAIRFNFGRMYIHLSLISDTVTRGIDLVQ